MLSRVQKCEDSGANRPSRHPCELLYSSCQRQGWSATTTLIGGEVQASYGQTALSQYVLFCVDESTTLKLARCGMTPSSLTAVTLHNDGSHSVAGALGANNLGFPWRREHSLTPACPTRVFLGFELPLSLTFQADRADNCVHSFPFQPKKEKNKLLDVTQVNTLPNTQRKVSPVLNAARVWD
jgi:hypothetical protein